MTNKPVKPIDKIVPGKMRGQGTMPNIILPEGPLPRRHLDGVSSINPNTTIESICDDVIQVGKMELTFGARLKIAAMRREVSGQ